MKTETTWLDYKLVGANEPQMLCDEVQNEIGEGWKSIGGIAVSFSEEYGQWYFQAMTKKFPLPRPEPRAA